MADNKATTVDFNNIQTGEKAAEGGDNKQSQPDFDSEAFFTALEAQVNGYAYDTPPTVNNTTQEGQVSTEGDKSTNGEVKDLEALQQRYDASSTEAKRLYKELSELKEYEPVINVIRKDPNLAKMVYNYLNGDNTEMNPSGQLELPEDFVFDFEDALGNPNSDSAKYFNQAVDRVASARVNELQTRQEATMREQNMINAVKAKHGLNDEQVNDLLNYARNKTLELEDVLYLRQRENAGDASRQQLIEEENAHRRKMRQHNGSLAGVSAPTGKDTPTPEQQVFAAILASDKSGNIFGN